MPFIPLYIEELGRQKPNRAVFRSGNLSDCVCSCNHCAGLGKFSRSERSQIDDDSGGCWYDSHHGLISLCTECLLAIDYALLYGILSGYIPNATALIASQAPKEKSGWALGTLATGAIAGNLIGPSMGGALAQWFGMKNVFIITGSFF